MDVQQKYIDAFWRCVFRANGCWCWIGSKNKRDYGAAHTNLGTIGAHRLSYMIHYGQIQDGLVVRHKCDNPQCTNPDHLETGTLEDNSMDRCIRGGRNRKKKRGKPIMASTPPKQMRLTATDLEMLRQIKAKNCLVNDTDAVRYCIILAAKALKIDTAKILRKIK